jgi:hypothetical protein
MQFNKLYLSISLLLIGAIWVACVDVPSGPGTNPNPDFRSMARFVNLAPTKPAGSINVDGVATGASMNYLGNTGYLDVAAGSRSLSFGGSAAVTQAFGSEQQSTLVIYEVPGTGTATEVAYLNLVEGDYQKNNADPAFAKMKFVNVANGAAANVIFRKNSATGSTIATSAFGAASQYLRLDADASDTIFALSGGGYTTGGQGSITSTTSGSKGFGTVDFSVDGGMVMNLTVKSKNSEGFYSSANISNGGSVQYAIPVNTQTMTFNSLTIGGGTTSASGTGTLTVTNDSASSGGASYSLTTTTPTSVGFFTSASIRNGATGPDVHTINVASQAITFPTTSASGAQEVPPVVTPYTASARGTFTLTRTSLAYSITVYRDAVDTPFTAMHFHTGAAGTNGGVVKNLKTTPWKNDSLVVAGTWRTTDTTQALTAALIDSIMQGRVYLNIHSTQRPAGLLRAQLVPNTTHSNTFSGRFTGASFDPLKDQFAFSNMYFRLASPADAIIGQAVPDTFTTNAYTATAIDVPNSVGDSLNAGSMYCNLTAAGGTISGQLNVDPTKGQYAVTSIANSAFSAARMYTLIATGKGPTFQILKLEDRVLGVNTKPVNVPDPKRVKEAVAPQTKASE